MTGRGLRRSVLVRNSSGLEVGNLPFAGRKIFIMCIFSICTRDNTECQCVRYDGLIVRV